MTARISKITYNHFEALAFDYDRQAAERGLMSAQVVADAVIRHTLHTQTPGLLVDLGAGTGRVLELLKEKFAKRAAVDFSQSMLNICRINGLADQYILCDLSEKEWPGMPQEVSVFTAAYVLEHIVNPGTFLGNMARRMNSGAIAALTYKPGNGRPKWANSTRILTEHTIAPFDMSTTIQKWGLKILEEEPFRAYKDDRTMTHMVLVLRKN